jgi:hypothetical protein
VIAAGGGRDLAWPHQRVAAELLARSGGALFTCCSTAVPAALMPRFGALPSSWAGLPGDAGPVGAAWPGRRADP